MKRDADRGWRRIDQPLNSGFDGRALILMYHRVGSAGSDPFSLCVSPQNFAEQLEVLRRHTHPMRLGQLTQAVRNETIPGKSVSITLDDGYADNLHNARVLLERFNIPATVFIATGNLGEEREFWWDELERVFLQPGTLPRTLCLNVDGNTYQWELSEGSHYGEDDRRLHRGWRAGEDAPTTRHAVYFSVWRLLQLLSETDRRVVLDQLVAWARIDSKGRAAYRSLSPPEVIALARADLVEIGAHTVTHPALPELSADSQRSEVQQSKAHLQEILGRPVTAFAYPYGARSQETVAIVRESGFTCACSTVPGLVHGGADHFQLPRVGVHDWDGEEFARQLTAWFEGTNEAMPQHALPMNRAPEQVVHGKWRFLVVGANAARLVFPTDDLDTVRIAIEKVATAAAFDIQLNQPHLNVTANHRYTIRLRARADKPRHLFLGFAEAHEPWRGLGLYERVELTPEWQSFQAEFVATADESNGRIHFDLGGSDISVDLSCVSMRGLPYDGSLQAARTL